MPTSLPAPAHAFGNLLAGAFVMPIIRIEQRASAVPLARALVAGGVRVFEVLLRTPCALDAIADIRTQVPEATVGAGTLLGAADVANALAAGAQFAVTPGLTPELAQAVVRHRLPTLPGVATASEVMQAMSLGFDALQAVSGPRPVGRQPDRGAAGRVPVAALLPHRRHQARAHRHLPGAARLWRRGQPGSRPSA